MTKKVTIGKDDVILLDETKLPKIVTPIPSLGDDREYHLGQNYNVIGISWMIYPDRTRSLCYILMNDRKVLDTHIASHFEVVS